jgi:glycosyltransferase involved in cell wall biosynthesis
MPDVPDYYNRVNPDLLSVIPADARCIVEVGCGTGAMAVAHRAVNPRVRYFGIEANRAAAEVAKSRLERVVVADAAEVHPEQVGVVCGEVDCLIFGDVLEHMTDPWTVLKRLVTWIRPGGQVIACIPNIAHWSTVLGLLRGDWTYQDEGLLDRTHVRFFTRETIERMVREADLYLFDIQPRVFPSPSLDAFVALLTPSLSALGVDQDRFAEQSSSLQYIVRAVRGEPPRRMLIQTLAATPICSRVRTEEPDRLLRTIPGVRTTTSYQAASFDEAKPGEQVVFIRQRNLLSWPDDLVAQRELVRRGYLVIAEFDDDPDVFPRIKESNYLTFRGCHAVQVSTEALADRIRPYNPNIQVFRNQLASVPPPRQSQQADGRPITIFFGALNRETDWPELIPALNRIILEFGPRIQFTVLHDHAFFRAIATDRKIFEPFCPYPRYVEHLRASDIALLPLRPTSFNVCKSDLKLVECAAHGVVALASPTVYAQTIVDGESGLIFENPADFEAKLRALVADKPLRDRLAAGAREYVVNQRLLCDSYCARYQWYVELIDRLPALTRELIARVPELRS